MVGEHLSHAYIFSGQEMIGKWTFALELANQINKTVESVMQPDILVVDPSSSESGESIPIEQIRKTKNFLSLRTYTGPYKFVIINDAEKMTVESQNAFLKILEEPSESSIIILVSGYPEVLLPTILSRCQEIKFPDHSTEDIKQVLLAENSIKEKVKLHLSGGAESSLQSSGAVAEFLSEFVNGRLGLALKIARENLYPIVKKYLSEWADIKKSSLNDKFKVAQALNGEEGNKVLKEKLLYWMLYLHMRSRLNLDQYKFQGATLRHLIELNYVLGQSQFNRRLMLENFMVKM